MKVPLGSPKVEIEGLYPQISVLHHECTLYPLHIISTGIIHPLKWKLETTDQNRSKTYSKESKSSTHSDNYYYPPKEVTESVKDSRFSTFPVATPRTNKRYLKVIEFFLLEVLQRNKIQKEILNSENPNNLQKMDNPSRNTEETQEEVSNENTVEGKEDMFVPEILNQKILEMQEELLEPPKKEGKNKYSSYTLQENTIH
ncbi:hypothetical protein O181_034114 [Austropuccinia psidii MF-1]|uniref:Uncharacterized protein n=1 Tax=Austropuccinia psidii MF-1 TaxID=1389203 RepID=A0A9Q3D026_9BASI|nr:hypothetical protein [Austropuccinia psidii MF-1]